MVTDIEQLPVLGVGASLSLSAQPDPVELAKKAGGPQFVEYAGRVDPDVILDEVSRIREAGVPVLFHPSYINFCGSYENSSIWLETTAEHIEAVGSAWFAQDCAYCFWQSDYGYSTQLGYFVPPIFNQASLETSIARVKEVQQKVPAPIAIEPPPMTHIIGTMPMFEFFGELSRATGCALLLDMGHLVSYEMAGGRHLEDELDYLPLESVVEVHVAGGKLREADAGPIYIDAHEKPILAETWEMFERMLPLLPGVRAVCFECEGVDEQTVMSTLQKIREQVNTLSSSKALVEHIRDVA